MQRLNIARKYSLNTDVDYLLIPFEILNECRLPAGGEETKSAFADG
ncbi:hypothetical protein HMPREF0208_00547 [Citrobacter koseri]|uniref:Uncharacterized protein n=1 Tax=Citrobacter koseri (strain ATCC BAA-895 / CDC 4225-83 / SGSC4696) TaxID=290338 RepID=A8AKG1_CITK8|nr:hypothetical protein CKO_02868 [Citrobacter koseri ATCC BAA-895]KWZ97724.1 hypothetical protein HMPREF3207_04421 [Citrobacter koseri]KXA01791.1 hypothetical protein HMPREF3220_01360 [Citrobacter koseri]KXB46661.1 hypothetical protein HMPREF0208_00547 [Citrobacter koseri]